MLLIFQLEILTLPNKNSKITGLTEHFIQKIETVNLTKIAFLTKINNGYRCIYLHNLKHN